MLQKSSLWRTAGLFFQRPTDEMYLIEISKLIDLAHTSVKKNLKILMKRDVIEERMEQRGSRKFPLYKAKINSKEYRKHKQIFNYALILESGLIEHLEETIMPRCIVLFGSYQKGEDTEMSDIDLFVEARGVSFDLSKFEKKLNRKIQLHFNERFDSYPKELRNNIINGIVLFGYLEALR